jgi:hypothetical protein
MPSRSLAGLVAAVVTAGGFVACSERHRDLAHASRPQLRLPGRGELTLERFLGAKGGCTQTEFQAGVAYVEVAEQVHRVVVPAGQSAAVLVTRLNIPGNNAPFTIPADDPGC